MKNTILLFLTYISIISIFILLIIIYFLNKNKKDIGLANLKVSRRNKLWIKIYLILTKFKLTNLLIQKIRKRLIIISESDENKIREDCVKIFLLIYIPTLFIVVLSIFFLKKWYIVIILLFALASISSAIIDIFMAKITNSLLLEMIDFNEILRKKYMHYKMVDEAFYSAIEEMDAKKYANILRQANKIYEVLISSNSEYKLNEYYFNAPSRHLKLIAGIAHLTKEYGDSYKSNSSLFASSLNQISSEIREEVLLKSRLNVALNTLYVIILVPILAIMPIRLWAGNNFFPMKQFYDSPLGMIAELAVLIVVLLSFVLLRNVQNMNEVEDGMYREAPFYKKIYDRFYKFFDYFIPSKVSVRYRKTQKLLKKAMYFGQVEWHYTDKVLKMITLMVVSSLFIFVFSSSSIKSILYNPVVPKGFLGGEMSDTMKEESLELSRIDREIINELNGSEKEKSLYSIKTVLIENYEFDRDFVDIHAKRIYNKIEQYNSLKFNYKYILFVYLTSFMGYFLPDLFLKLKIAMIKIDIKTEVVKFQMLIGILMYVKNMSVDNILEWLERFSYVYKEPLQKAIMNYDSGSRKALEELKNVSDYDEFKKLIDHLIYSIEELSIIDSFAELEAEKLYYKEKRRDENLLVIEKKINLGKFIGFTPIYALILLYFVIPLIYVSIQEMGVYLSIIR